MKLLIFSTGYLLSTLKSFFILSPDFSRVIFIRFLSYSELLGGFWSTVDIIPVGYDIGGFLNIG